MPDTFSLELGDGPLVATAIHAGHALRPEIAERIALDPATRLREEDPFTDRPTVVAGTRFVAHRSRFEVDLNRLRSHAVYREPDDAWGLHVWRRPLPDDVVERSLAVHDEAYAALAEVLDALADQGPFVVLDLHSYNHRRHADRSPAPADENPEVNVGTGSLDRDRWGGLVDRFMADLSGAGLGGRPIDVRENVRFKGGHLSQWVHERYPARGCALAIELKKTFMDEWTGVLDEDHLDGITAALRVTVPGLLDALAEAGR